MRQMDDQSLKLFFSKPLLAQRYAVSTRAIERWILSGRFPRPDLVLPNGRPRWSDEVVVAHERAAIGKKGINAA
jgi:hypothetical protein